MARARLRAIGGIRTISVDSYGRLTFDNAVISYSGDFVIHFNHPTWRDDRNDPATATRVSGRKMH